MLALTSYINLSICLSSFKLLFLKSYVSTDFDVHRNWMAITYNLPIKDWYFENTSEWTLDYPPLFAAFEFLLALIAQLVGLEGALNLTSEKVRSESMVIYQKSTVILSDLVYYYAVYRLCRSLEPIVPKLTIGKRKNIGQQQQPKEKTEPIISLGQNLLDSIYRPDPTSCMALLLLLQPGLLLVDHIHFQYNGLLSGIMLLSMASIVEGNHISGAFWFAVLLNFKHIYLYCAPAYGMYLISGYCLLKRPNENRFINLIKRATKLGIVVVLVFIITYFPFADMSTLEQIAARLFPFKRGLTHAYWAPNFWSLYNTADKVLSTIFKSHRMVKFDLDSISGIKPKSSTSGLAQEYEHQYLPSISPLTTFVLVAVFTLPLIIKYLLNTGKPSPKLFMKGVILAAFNAFMFGWHVHEKAIILVLLPMIPLSSIQPNLGRALLRLTLAGTYSLFPLLFQPAEYLTKLTILIAYYCYARSLIHTNQRESGAEQNTASTQQDASFRVRVNWLMCKIYNLLDVSLVLGLVVIEIYNSLVFGRLTYSWNPVASLDKLQFLPLLLTSSFSALGITFSYLELYYDFVVSADELAAAAA